MSTWNAEKCTDHEGMFRIDAGGLILACFPTMRQAADLANAHNAEAAQAADLLTERDDARASALRAVDRARELEQVVLDTQEALHERESSVKAELDVVTVERDEARRQNIALNMRLVGAVPELLDVQMKRWSFVEARTWRVPPLDDDERELVRAAYAAVGVGEGTYAGSTELLQVLKGLPQATAERLLGQIQQSAADGGACWERGHDNLADRLHRAHSELREALVRAEGAEQQLTPVRRLRDELAEKLVRARHENGMAAVDELQKIQLQLARGAVDGYPDTATGRGVATLCRKLRDLHQELQVARHELHVGEAARLDATQVALATLTRITTPLKRRLRRTPEETP